LLHASPHPENLYLKEYLQVDKAQLRGIDAGPVNVLNASQNTEEHSISLTHNQLCKLKKHNTVLYHFLVMMGT